MRDENKVVLLKTGRAGGVEFWIEGDQSRNRTQDGKKLTTILVTGSAFVCLAAYLITTNGEAQVPKATSGASTSAIAESEHAQISPEKSTPCDDEQVVQASVANFLEQSTSLDPPARPVIVVTEESRSTIGSLTQVQIATNCPKFPNWLARTSTSTGDWSVKKNHPAEPLGSTG